MNAVVDASALVAALTDSGGDGKWASRQLDIESLAAPQMLMAEVSNVLRRLESSGRLSPMEANASAGELRRFDIEYFPFAPFAHRIWALRFGLSAYDAWYVALAEALNWPLVTLDRKMAAAPGTECKFVLPPS